MGAALSHALELSLTVWLVNVCTVFFIVEISSLVEVIPAHCSAQGVMTEARQVG
jgi:hypothetical protein